MSSTIGRVFTTISHQFPGKEEAVLQEFHDNHIIWCCWDDDLLLYNISWYVCPETLVHNSRDREFVAKRLKFFSKGGRSTGWLLCRVDF